MSNQQDETTTPVWSPTPNAMDIHHPLQTAWYNDPAINDIIQGPHRDPWNAYAGQQQPRPNAPTSWNTFMDYRDSHNILSEDGTVPESAAGEAHFHYDTDMASLAGAGPEAVGATQMLQLLDGIQIDHLGPHMPPMRDNAIDAASTFSVTTAGTGYRGPFKCGQCDKPCKSQSNLKKHEMTHSRPHLCPRSECAKKEGFSTPNDLQRHMDCVHGEAKFGYKCPHGDCAGLSGPKPWPRKDNFRTHMLKVHKMSIPPDVADAKYRIKIELRAESIAPSDDATPVESLTPPGMDAQLAGANRNTVESTTTMMDIDQSQFQSQQATSTIMPNVSYFEAFGANSLPASQYPSFQNMGRHTDMSFGTESAHSLQGHQTSGFGSQSFTTQTISVTGGDIFVPSMVNNPGFQTATQPRPPSQGASAMEETRPRDSPGIGSVFSSSAARGSFTVASSQTHAQTSDAICHDNLIKQGWDLSQLLAHLGTFPAELLEQALESKKHNSYNVNESEENSGSKICYPCNQCDKVCNRACELKKHMKRHDRPYGCTAKGCNKSFGSKNDWKRHEDSQHPFVEAWACDEDGCIVICEDRFTFMQHVREAHDIVHTEDLRSRAQSCQIGTKSDARFWCGFCRRVIEIDEILMREDGSSNNHWNRRFDHIDNHLFGKGGLEEMNKSQWRYLEDEAKGGTQQRMNHMSATASVRSTTTSNGAPSKRKGSEYADSRPRKRADGQWAAGH